jgi:hypothetical protein
MPKPCAFDLSRARGGSLQELFLTVCAAQFGWKVVKHVRIQKVLLLVPQLRPWYQQPLSDSFTESIAAPTLAATHELDAFVAIPIPDINVYHLERHLVSWLIWE